MANVDKRSNDIRVFVRQRPLTNQELDQKHFNVIHNATQRDFFLRNKCTEKKYTFDHVFNENASQLDVYNSVAVPLMSQTISGYNCTVLAYGQTGTGKTHTIFGNPNNNFGIEKECGLVPKIAIRLFKSLSKLDVNVKYTVQISFSEVYNEEVRDLFGEGQHLRVYDDPLNRGAVCVKDLTKITVFSETDVLSWLKIGFTQRQSAATNYNVHSSRSHALFTFFVNTRERVMNSEDVNKTGQLLLVDLAGSEFVSKTGTAETMVRDSSSINRSLANVGKVIKALCHKMQHVPYRDSKLTRILQESLGGATKTSIIATFSPSSDALEETVSTLDLVTLARSITNRPLAKVNKKCENPIRAMETELVSLEKQLQAARVGQGFYVSAENYTKLTQDAEGNTVTIMDQIRKVREYESHLQSMELEFSRLNRSFDFTKEYLSDVERKVKEKEKIVSRGENYLHYLEKQHSDLKATAEQLLQVSQRAMHTENIYYNKYQNSCDVKIMNTETAHELGKLVQMSIKAISHETKINFKDQQRELNIVQDILEAVKNSIKPTNNALQYTKNVSGEDMTSYFKNGSQLVVKQYERNRERLEGFRDVHDLLKATKQRSWSQIENMEAKQSSCIETTTAVINRNKQLRQFLHKMSHNDKENERKLVAQVTSEEAMIATITAELRRLEEKEKVLDVEIVTLEDDKRRVKQFIDDSDSMLEHQALKECTADLYKQPSKFIHEIKTATENATDKICQMKEILKDDCIVNCNELDQFSTELFQAIDKDLRDSEIRTILRGLCNAVNIQKQATLKTTSLCEQAVEHLGSLQALNRDFNSRVEQTVSQSLNQLGSVEKKSIYNGHSGDTPAKKNYKYPQINIEIVPFEITSEENL